MKECTFCLEHGESTDCSECAVEALQAKYDALKKSHEELVKALERINDQASKTICVQDRSVNLIKQCLRYMQRNAEQALAEAEKI